ncbi:hypothetical protein SPRG_03564 [Saprolegnia parasitica CBS 223.65]|uniref:Farnesoic acid O-methyl transferase domain-containing protein n=1 Tax=Saprolegnia parasitica (strain CBS 223.65) TaxID=695850 RepID=A0A067CLS5_SAPPC|nr:hypothetical protein SPRG_03564 [Saprolegnia parasitica CBS 223.65]KDO31644.1 hypothetical protein SPRG_03564 [Saprolegnia parasitica CBS 223.65]|eukprot:XP_012197534.1 hypothetical protein SPRG_03564 [Saprolegnia parasitica CBS 223.65]
MDVTDEVKAEVAHDMKVDATEDVQVEAAAADGGDMEVDEVKVEEPVVVEARQMNLPDVEVSALLGRVASWTDINMHLQHDTVNAFSLTLHAQCQQELQIHTRVRVNGTIDLSYEFLCGGQGNTEASILKRRGSSRDVEVACVFCGRICSDTQAGQYWFNMTLHRKADGDAYFQLSSGIGNGIGDKLVIIGQDLLPKDTTRVEVVSVGVTSGRSPVRARAIQVAAHTQALLSSEVALCVMSDPSGTDLLTPEQRTQYVAGCEGAKKRAQRFNSEYKQPDVKQFLDSKIVRMMQRSGAVTEKGFTTGFDVMSAEEVAKREARRNRFNVAEYAIEGGVAREISEGLTEDELAKRSEEAARRAGRAAKFGIETQGNMQLHAASPKVLAERVDMNTALEARDDAIHMYSLDDAFTSVRTRDILAYFTGYGPSYVEWINDSSCTIVFHDAFTVSRALLSLSADIAPEILLEAKPVKDLVQNPFAAPSDDMSADSGVSAHAAGWRVGVPIKASDHMDRNWRLLLRRATINDFPPEKPWKRDQYQRGSHRRAGGRQQQSKKRGRDDNDDDDGMGPNRRRYAKRIHS